jgi:hypothetical protein
MSLDKKRSEVHEDPAIGRLAMAGSTVQVPSAADVIFRQPCIRAVRILWTTVYNQTINSVS